MDAWRERVVAEASTWLRTPWLHRGRVKGAGVDCAQLLIGVFAAAGVIENFDTGEYPPDWMLHQEEERFLGFITSYMKPTTESPQPADVVLWKFGRGFSHAAIVLEWPMIIHAYRPEGMVVYGSAEDNVLRKHKHMVFTKS